MKNTFVTQSGKLSDLREVAVKISGRSYSAEFISGLNENTKGKIAAMHYDSNHMISQYIHECLEIREDDAGEILWNAVEEWHRREAEQELKSSLGFFRAVDMGEFGGELITPNETLYGSFGELFEFNGKVYAIDTLAHLGIGHTKIYEFDSAEEHKLLYDTGSDKNIRKYLSLSALTKYPEHIYILISGDVIGEGMEFKDRVPCSILFEITKTGFAKLAEFYYDFENVYNMIVKSNKMMLGMDKVVAVADISTKEIKAYSPLTSEAENDITETMKKYI